MTFPCIKKDKCETHETCIDFEWCSRRLREQKVVNVIPEPVRLAMELTQVEVDGLVKEHLQEAIETDSLELTAEQEEEVVVLQAELDELGKHGLPPNYLDMFADTDNPEIIDDAKCRGGRPFEDSIMAMREWQNFDPELQYSLWHGESNYFPLKREEVRGGEIGGAVGVVACPCGCGTEYLNTELYNRLTHARVLAGVEFKVSSWCRCKDYDATFPSPQHGINFTEGYAVSVEIPILDTYVVVKSLIDVGFTNILLGCDFFVVSVDPSLPKAMNFYS